MAKKKRSEHDLAFQALQNLMKEPSDPLGPWHHLFGAYGPDNIRAMIDQTGAPSLNDRDAATIYSTLVEQARETAVASMFVDGEATKRLFSYNEDGPLATFQAKIDIGTALGMYGNDMRKDLWRVKAIRNAFAHAGIDLKFDHPVVSAACSYLGPSVALVAGLGGAKQKFLFTTGMLATYLQNYIGATHEKRSDLYDMLYGVPLQKP